MTQSRPEPGASVGHERCGLGEVAKRRNVVHEMDAEIQCRLHGVRLPGQADAESANLRFNGLSQLPGVSRALGQGLAGRFQPAPE